jgi:hypothetical protein
VSDWIWALPLCALIVGVGLSSIWYSQRVVAELARRPEKEFQVAGIDRVRTLQSQSLWGMGPWRMRRIRRRLDRAAARIAAFEQGQRERDQPPWHP